MKILVFSLTFLLTASIVLSYPLFEVQHCPRIIGYHLIASKLCSQPDNFHCVPRYPLMKTFMLACQKPVWFARGTCPVFKSEKVHSMICPRNQYTDKDYMSNSINIPKLKHFCTELGQKTFGTNSSMDNLCYCMAGFAFAERAKDYCHPEDDDCVCVLVDIALNNITDEITDKSNNGNRVKPLNGTEGNILGDRQFRYQQMIFTATIILIIIASIICLVMRIFLNPTNTNGRTEEDQMAIAALTNDITNEDPDSKNSLEKTNGRSDQPSDDSNVDIPDDASKTDLQISMRQHPLPIQESTPAQSDDIAMLGNRTTFIIGDLDDLPMMENHGTLPITKTPELYFPKTITPDRD